MVQKRMLFATTATVMGLAASVFATPNFMQIFNRVEKPAKGTPLAKAGCYVCHVKAHKMGELNPYGTDFDNNGVSEAALKKIRSIDSDKDGATNAAEIAAGTLPGDKTSKPAHKKK